MAKQLTAEDARNSLTGHVESKGIELFIRYGSAPGWDDLQQILADRTQVRYPCEIVFDATPLLPGEFAHPVQKGDSPEEGFTMAVHPVFAAQPHLVPALVLYQLVAVNYGDFASSLEAETFGAACLGLTRDEYYSLLCDCATQVDFNGEVEASVVPPAGCGGGGCNCNG
jgi:hypothetical protein